HPAVVLCVEPHPDFTASIGSADRVSSSVHGDVADFVHLSPPHPACQASSHSLDLPALVVFSQVSTRVLFQFRMRRFAALALDRRVVLPLHAHHPGQLGSPGLPVGTALWLSPLVKESME